MKIGDKVKCVNADGAAFLEEGCLYTITYVETDDEGDWVSVDLDYSREGFGEGDWYADRFEIVEEA